MGQVRKCIDCLVPKRAVRPLVEVPLFGVTKVIGECGAQLLRDVPIENATILVRDGKIAAVGPAARVTVPAGADRVSLAGTRPVDAFLGLERVLNDLGWLDSLITPTARMIALDPKETIYRVSQLRTFQLLGRQADVRRAFDAWVAVDSTSASPYREYSRLLIELNQVKSARQVVEDMVAEYVEVATKFADALASLTG